tara:strand:+ start:185 stop:526 length:342 start_codon:yes stop_codon:yes gene_type:complete
MELIDDKLKKRREYQNNYVKNRKMIDEDFRLREQTRINQHIKEKLKNDDEFRIKYNEKAKLRKRNHTEKVRNERIELYNNKIVNYDITNGDMKEYFRMCRYVARYKSDSSSSE